MTRPLTEEQEKALEAVKRFLLENVWGGILVQTKPGGFQLIKRTYSEKPDDIE